MSYQSGGALTREGSVLFTSSIILGGGVDAFQSPNCMRILAVSFSTLRSVSGLIRFIMFMNSCFLLSLCILFVTMHNPGLR